MGSPRRKEFTAIGDTVNLASRLEQLTKEVGTPLLVSDAVCVRLSPGRGPATFVGEMPIRGYPVPVRVWQLE